MKSASLTYYAVNDHSLCSYISMRSPSILSGPAYLSCFGDKARILKEIEEIEAETAGR